MSKPSSPIMENVFVYEARCNAAKLRRIKEAAPDLLEALEDLLRDEQLDDDDQKLIVTRAKARAALLKAKG